MARVRDHEFVARGRHVFVALPRALSRDTGDGRTFAMREDKLVPGIQLEIWRYCADSAYYIFGDAIGDPVADELLVALRRAGTVGMTRTAVSVEVFSRNRGAVEIDRALAVLEQRGSARRTTETTAGRPAVRWTAT